MGVWINLLLLYLIVIISSNAEKEKNLTGIEGGSITFPKPVLQRGYLANGRRVIASVTERKAKIPRDPWKDKVHWNNTTGIFTITELQTSDSGIYAVDVMKGDAAFYKLTVFEPILILPVVRVNVTTESCTLLCAVEKPAGTTLWWSKDRKKVKQSSSSLSLPLTINTQEFNSSYKCEAATPAEVKSLEVIVTELCSEGKNSEDENTDQTNGNGLAVGTKVAISVVLTLLGLVLGLATLAGFLIVRKRFKKDQSTPPVNRMLTCTPPTTTTTCIDLPQLHRARNDLHHVQHDQWTRAACQQSMLSWRFIIRIVTPLVKHISLIMSIMW
ncbi:uncharacterized protein LOC142880622 isoform X3 [Nelusetta ayraudi]|uniref:uncharacterized protein LOC142880622 isoform X3 n=1 Tax=Nelusetta ayraudi TaxID=303726 RepID=UPI003F71EC5F